MKNIINFFKSLISKISQPYYSSTFRVRGLAYAIGVAATVAILLAILSPFGIFNLDNKPQIVLISSFVAFMAMLVAEFGLPAILQDFYNESKWTLGKQLFQLVLMVVLVLGSVLFYLDNFTGADINFGEFLIKGIVSTIIPLILFAYIQQSIHHNKYTQQADELNDELNKKGVINADANIKLLHFNGKSQSLNLIPNQLIYVKISKSISEFVYQQPLGIANLNLEIPESEVRTELAGHVQFVKFHDDIILNANAIQKISGNAGGFEVGIARINEHLKVANKYKKNLKNL